uniref:Uncharacterized protein LOC113791080 n=1 Tax=Dermatophagoides pteronyssinus TaxID=6956 RepID=A0A6P6XT38_DERPT|nr:uncharacterized protein LOC113791080 [Dermatophagoides pteronyssinus]
MNSTRFLRLASSSMRFHHFMYATGKSSTGIVAAANESLSKQIIRLPEKHRENFAGDNESKNKLPMLDFHQSIHPLYCAAFSLHLMINSNATISIENFQNPSLTWNPKFNDKIIIQSPFPKQNEHIICPTTTNNASIEKRADYYKHKDPNRFTHLTWVRHRKMKKHQRIKWRKKNLAMIKRRILERNIAKEKQFRAEILAQIKEAEEFDPRAYVQNILYTIDNVPQAETPQQKYERYLDLIRKNRQQTNLVMPKFEKID